MGKLQQLLEQQELCESLRQKLVDLLESDLGEKP